MRKLTRFLKSMYFVGRIWTYIKCYQKSYCIPLSRKCIKIPLINLGDMKFTLMCDLQHPPFAFDSSTLYKESIESKLILNRKFSILPTLLHSSIMYCFFAVYWFVSNVPFCTTPSQGRHYHTLPCNSVLYSAYKQKHNIVKMKLHIFFTVPR
jgi:hypothetical protein